MFNRLGFPRVNFDGEGGGGGGGGGNPPAPWYQGVTGYTDDLAPVLQAKGWDKMTPQEAAVAATISFRNAEKVIGVPQEELFRIPKNNDPEVMGKLYARLGRPEKPEGYDFSNVKFTDGSGLGDGLTNKIRDVAFKRGLSSDAAVELATAIRDQAQGDADATLAEHTTKLQEQQKNLAEKWGVPVANIKTSAQFQTAKDAVTKLGLPQEFLDNMEKSAGYDTTMEILRFLGEGLREARFVDGDAGNKGGPKTMGVEQAQMRKDQLMADKAWVQRYNNGDTEARGEMSNLNRIIVSKQSSPVY